MPDAFIDLRFPLAGIDRSRAFSEQKPREIGEGEYARTTVTGKNVRGFESLSQRGRGGSRPGLAKYVATRPHDFILQDLNTVTTTAE